MSGGAHTAGEGRKAWNSGTSKGWVDSRGYRWLYVEENGRKRARREHRVLMERHLGRKLEPWEIVHHRDGNRSNNSLDNLEVMEFGQHTREHNLGARKSWETRRTLEAFGLMRQALNEERRVIADLLEAAEGLLAASDALDWLAMPDEFVALRAAIQKARPTPLDTEN